MNDLPVPVTRSSPLVWTRPVTVVSEPDTHRVFVPPWRLAQMASGAVTLTVEVDAVDVPPSSSVTVTVASNTPPEG